MRILITGADGQLGTELRHLLDAHQLSYRATDSHDLDITDKTAVQRYFKAFQPQIVYHCAAYTAVDAAETEPGKTTNQAVNATGTANVAVAAEQVGATLVYISTDYVFAGDQHAPYTTDAQPAPQNEYGRAKYAGEQAVQRLASRYYIIRTSWVFGEYGHNFIYTMLKLAQDHDQLTVVNDQVGRPAWTRTLAEFMTFATDHQLPYGIYHLAATGTCSWYQFARTILQDRPVTVKPVTSAEYPQKAWRPRHAVLDLSKTLATGFKLPSWQEALAAFMQEIAG
ncbi:dTDP-4-dehydrorhamnose reductase [Loigolactobacillus rennini]|uniref:dTDP-4-dehydrorhamnose reductase n=2 Tax=Loigolactobacillus rennini TaxID=238013 RepID=A0A0R2D0C4_9LACO|nr:dTDP-4-dehydrorhamnose reductase [Loigolactobacillus rennini]KRM97424.1 dTDP-4-dehydrorhamnose reductase [Loigolactobacillus rennini DSM 20253]SFZ87244.1 dTDP-4-dehydrorhamnose reductase [Loigolactobacillus rennini]